MTAGLCGLAALPAEATLHASDVPAAALPLKVPQLTVDPPRASRDRQLPTGPLPQAAAVSPSPSPAAPSPKVAPKPPPSPAAAPKPPAPKATPPAKVKPKPAAARRTASGSSCPVPAASFTDTWGAPRSGGRRHQGTDLLAPYGSSVYALAAGRVNTTSSRSGGISLYLKAANGDTYFYAHNSANLVGDGERVEAGQLIAQVGATGNARGGPAHVHFELQPGGGGAARSYGLLRKLCR